LFVVKIAPNMKPEHIKNEFVDDPLFTGLVSAVNTELQNNTRGVLECFALDGGYTVKHENVGFNTDVMEIAEATELH
jgi:hypothetical protein